MPNYNIVADYSQFKPMDIGPALMVLRDYKDKYEKQQAIYDLIAQLLGDLSVAVQGSPDAKKIYDEYSDRFNNAVDSFSKGMNYDTNRELNQLRALYGTKIKALEKANEARVKEAEKRRAEKDPTMLYLDIGNLDSWIKDPYRLLGSYSGDKLTLDTMNMIGLVALSIADLLKNGKLDEYHDKWIKTVGFSAPSIEKAISEVQKGGILAVEDPIYKNILLNVMDSSGIYKWGDNDTVKRAEMKAAQGLRGGIGKTEVGQYENKEAAAILEINKQINLLRALATEALRQSMLGIGNGSNKNATISGTIPINTDSIVSPAYDLKNYLEVLNRYMNLLGIYKDEKGNFKTREAEIDLYENEDFNPSYGFGAPRYNNYKASLFDKNGNMKTKHQFTIQGKTDEEKKALAEYYDKTIKPALFNMGISVDAYNKAGKSPKLGTVISAYNTIYSDTGALEAKFIPMVLSEDGSVELNVIDRYVSKVQKSGKDTLSAGTVYRVNGWNKDGELSLDSNPVSIKELKEDGLITMYTHPGHPYINEKGQISGRTPLSNYLIFRKNGRTYAIEKKEFGSIINNHLSYGDLYAITKNNKELYILDRIELLKQLYGDIAELPEEVLRALAEQDYKETIDNWGSAYIRSLGTALDYNYDVPAYKLHNDSESAMP